MVENVGVVIARAHFTTTECRNATGIFKKATFAAYMLHSYNNTRNASGIHAHSSATSLPDRAAGKTRRGGSRAASPIDVV